MLGGWRCWLQLSPKETTSNEVSDNAPEHFFFVRGNPVTGSHFCWKYVGEGLLQGRTNIFGVCNHFPTSGVELRMSGDGEDEFFCRGGVWRRHSLMVLNGGEAHSVTGFNTEGGNWTFSNCSGSLCEESPWEVGGRTTNDLHPHAPGFIHSEETIPASKGRIVTLWRCCCFPYRLPPWKLIREDRERFTSSFPRIYSSGAASAYSTPL